MKAPHGVRLLRRVALLVCLLAWTVPVPAGAQDGVEILWTVAADLRERGTVDPASPELHDGLVECVRSAVAEAAPQYRFVSSPPQLGPNQVIVWVLVVGFGTEGERMSDAEFLLLTNVLVQFPSGSSAVMTDFAEGGRGSSFSFAGEVTYTPPCPTQAIRSVTEDVFPRLEEVYGGGGR